MPAAIADRVWAVSLRVRGAIDPRTPFEPEDLDGSGSGVAVSANSVTAGWTLLARPAASRRSVIRQRTRR